MSNAKGKGKGDKNAFRPMSIVEAKMTMIKAGYDIIDIVLSKINAVEDEEDNLFYEIKVSDYAELLGLKHSKNAYRKMAQACESMQGKGFELYRDRSGGKKKFYVWFPSIDYDDERQSVILELHKDTKAMLVEAKRKREPITYYGLRYVLPMKSQYSKRIYYMCKEFTKSGKRYDALDDLRIKLDIPASYRYGMIKKNVFEKAVEEINSLSDITVSFNEAIEKGRGGSKVVGITWNIKIKNTMKAEKTAISKSLNVEKKRCKNKFNDFEQNDYDFAAIEQLTE